MDISEISRLLASKIDQLVPQLLPNARKVNHEWQCGSLSGEAGRSLCINTAAKRGVWKDFSGDEGGDALDLVSSVLFGGDKKQGLAWARSWLGLDNLSPDRLKQVRQQAAVTKQNDDEIARQQAAKKMAMARAIWLNSFPQLGGSPVDNYLFNRAIDLAKLDRQPSALRYAGELDHIDPDTGVITTWPAMVGTIIRDGAIVGIHRTFLGKTALGVWTKAPVNKPKLTLGAWRGGFIPLSRGQSGVPIAKAPEGDVVILAEGVEDALSLALLYPECRCLAAVSIGNMANIDLPNSIAAVHIAVDNDVNNPQADAAIKKAIKKFQAEGRDVYTKRSPIGKDFNDLLIQKIKAQPATYLNKNQDIRA